MSIKNSIRAIACASAAVMLTSVSASALSLSGTIESPLPSNNAFLNDGTIASLLGAASNADVGMVSAFSVSFTHTAESVLFEEKAAEASYANTFSSGGLTMKKRTSPVGESFSIAYAPAVFGFDWLFSCDAAAGPNACSGAGGGVAQDAGIGNPNMAVFYKKSTDGNLRFTDGDMFVLALDDQSQGDDNHDDYIIKATVTIDPNANPIPLPAGVWLMGTALAGFGVASRRRRKS